MSQKKIFTLINLSLIAISGFLVYYLANAGYVAPTEIRKAETLVNALSDKDRAAPTPNVQVANMYKGLRDSTGVMDALFKLTPSPTPSPAPTATPVSLAIAINPWKITELDPAYVGLVDQRTNEEFQMLLNGPPKEVEAEGQKMMVKLCGVNLDSDPPKAKFCSGSSEHEINF